MDHSDEVMDHSQEVHRSLTGSSMITQMKVLDHSDEVHNSLNNIKVHGCPR